MRLEDLLAPAHVVHGLRAANKEALLDDLSRRAGHALDIAPAVILSALRTREALGSTGIGDGVALPHARLDPVRKPLGLLAKLREPLDFEAVDDRPVDLVCLLLLPVQAQGESLNALACVARRFRDRATATALRSARDAAGLYALMTGGGVGADR